MQSVPKIVVKRLQSPTAADPHPDADLLTAFAERSLAVPERDHILEHLARCGDCRAVVSLALPPQVGSLPLAGTSVNWFGANWFRSTPLRRSALRWAAVAAGVVLIALIGILQTRRQRSSELAVNVFERKQATTAPAQSSPPASHLDVPQARLQGDQAAVPRAQSALAEKKAARPEGAISQPRANSAAATGGPLGGAAIGSVASGTLNVGRNRNFAFDSSRQNRRSARAPGPNPAPAPKTSVIAGSSQAIEVQTENALVATQPTAPGQIQDQVIQNESSEPMQSSADRVGKAKPALAQASPALPAPSRYTDSTLMKGGAAVRWTISAGGVLQRSPDGGQTWLDVNIASDDLMRDRRAKTQMATVEVQAELPSEAQSQPQPDAKKQAKFKNNEKQPAPAAPVIFRALSVSANADEVWAGGSTGALYHTLDGGNSWTRVVPSATGISLTGDILSIQFSDSQNGTVTTSSTEVWTTLDDGQTWHKQP
jgi:Photosynthesis system II assembly factor YCF48